MVPCRRSTRSRVPAASRSPLPATLLALATVIVALASPLSAQFDDEVVGEVPLAGLDPVSSNPYGTAIHPDPSARLAYAALAGQVAPFGQPPSLHSGSTVVEFRTDTLEVVRTFAVGFYPNELAVTPDGAELYATVSTESTLYRVLLATGAVSAIPLTDSLGGAISYPSGVEVSPSGAQLWVTSNGGGFDGSHENLVVVDRASGLVVDRIVIAGGIGRIAVRADGRTVIPVGYPADDFSAPPEIRIYDTSPWTLVATLPVAVDTADFPAPSDVALSADGSRAYVTIFGGSSAVFVVDVDAAGLLPSLPLAGTDFVQSAIALLPGGATLAVADFFAGRIRRIDRQTGALLGETTGLSLPNSILPATGRLFVTEQGLEQVAVVALPGAFRRGDANLDGWIDVADGVHVLQFLFNGEPISCEDAGDADDGGALDIADAVSIFAYLFQGGTAPSAPFPEAGGDPDPADPLDCAP